MPLYVIRAGALRAVAVYALFMWLAPATQAQQTGSVAPAAALPAGFPVYKDTGNPKEDHKRYDEAKRKWIEENPKEYGRLVGRVEGAEKKGVPKNAVLVETAPAMIPPYEPAKRVTDLPNNEHSARAAVPTLQATTAKQSEMSGNVKAATTADIPSDFPIYRDTQNPQADQARYAAEKDAWIAANPQRYAQMQSAQPQPQSSSANLSAATPPYPDAPQTGDIAADEAAHIKAKTAWIKEHPEEYRQAGGNPEELNNNKAINETATPNKPVFVLPTFNVQKAYQLIKAEAVLVAGQKKTAAEIAEETEKLKEDFPENRTQLQIGANNQIRIYASEVIDVRATEKRNDNKVEWFFENNECPTCSKTLYLGIEEETPTLLTYVMQSEDENAPFAYRLAFQLIVKP